MSLPTTASVSVTIDAPAETIYDLITDVTRMGEWSPECVKCEWLDAPGRRGSTFRGHNRRGLARWSTTARVLTADRPTEFSFATLHKGQDGTRWTYRLDPEGAGTRVTETFEAISAPRLIAFAERWLMRNRQAQLEAGMATTLDTIKRVAEREAAPGIDA
jgi:uncharacterized protein YndB with AHSA1/START domain